MTFKTLAASITAFVSATVTLFPGAVYAWELVNEGEGIKIYKEEIAGSPVIAFKGEGEIDATPLKVISVILDYANVSKWVDDMEEVRIIKQETDLKWIEYSHFGTPFIVKDRDFVTRVETKVDPVTGVIDLFQTSVDEKDYPPGTPQSDYVRGKVMRGNFNLKPIADGKKTFFSGELQADPMGNIPKWLVNFIQQSWPKSTLIALRKRVKEVEIEPHASIKRALEQKKP